MKKYLKMIPVMVYPYAYLPALIMLFSTPYEDAKIDAVYDGIIIYAVLLHLLVLAISIFNSVVTAKGAYSTADAARINMVTKEAQIPAYAVHFILGCMGFLILPRINSWGSYVRPLPNILESI